MRKRIGYLEGTDPKILSTFIAKGYNTMTLGNGLDNHGKYLAHIEPKDNIYAVIGYLHKFLPLTDQKITPNDLLYACRLHNIPVFVMVPKEVIYEGRKVLSDVSDFVNFVEPESALEAILVFLETK
ncbi:MAG: hypothetical protein AMQ74_00652 [Candidatus Methanofastidiosum methylothiophilum]|uniref:Uncharacterized protein n=1 Tax=Candidatus Methanofastidiosum methylothiophilum TaxID=1705564 RepID=A0A150J633_9EURY|nr:MAG: hypothetical protein AMQ74_00652 [Candidatus Methanofastidiosum methylthiophilus]NMC76831.1 hypothetical protein [Candidatus Methanofastidiosa archaeon]